MVVNVFRLPREDFAITVLSATVSFVSKRAAAGPAMMLDAPEMNAHLQSRFGTQVHQPHKKLGCSTYDMLCKFYAVQARAAQY